MSHFFKVFFLSFMGFLTLMACSPETRYVNVPTVSSDLYVDTYQLTETSVQEFAPLSKIRFYRDANSTAINPSTCDEETLAYTDPAYTAGFNVSVYNKALDTNDMMYFIPESSNPDYNVAKKVPFALYFYDEKGKHVSGFNIEGFFIGTPDIYNTFDETPKQLKELAGQKITVVIYYNNSRGVKTYTKLAPLKFVIMN